MENLMIVFEGIDGAGKGTQIELLKKELKKTNKKFFIFKYPTKKAKKIKDYLNQKIEISEEDAFFEYLKDIETEQNKVKEKLKNGLVICDRYFFSTLAYQSIEHPLEERLEKIKGFELLKPDFVIWLDISPQDALKRKLKNKLPDRFEQDLEKLKKIKQNYEKLYSLKFMSKNWIRIDSSEDKKEIFKEILQKIFKKF